MFVPVEWQLQHGVLDQTTKQRSNSSFPSRVRSHFFSPLQGEDRVPENDRDGWKHFHEERHPPGYWLIPLLCSDLPPRFLVEEDSSGRFR